jgi:hypothetical protein
MVKQDRLAVALNCFLKKLDGHDNKVITKTLPHTLFPPVIGNLGHNKTQRKISTQNKRKLASQPDNQQQLYPSKRLPLTH